ncbi:MAG: hypothetical protein WDA27_10100 [Actinomycetota bacterium]
MRSKKLAAIVITACLVAVAPAITPASAAEPGQAPGEFVFPFAGTVPCGTACAYNIPEDLYKACENPFPPGSYVDVVTKPAPKVPDGKRKVLLKLEAFPQVDWDTFICGMLSDGSHNGGELDQGANDVAETCDNLQGPESPIPVGCEEEAMAPVETGKQYVLRAYNYSDPFDCPAKYTWVFV